MNYKKALSIAALFCLQKTTPLTPNCKEVKTVLYVLLGVL